MNNSEETKMNVNIDPVIFEVGPIRVGWYGLMYVLGFLASYLLVRYQMKKKDFDLSRPEVENLYFYLILGLMVGARLGYVLFYDLKAYLADPFEIIAIWHGGMSFHGGLIGVLLVGVIFSWKNRNPSGRLQTLSL
jgi:phosphatidylglycerol:prolipoprotein diacylglycerol transferase